MSSSGHGHTPAAWTGVIISFIGFCVAGAFIVLGNVPGFWAGIVLIGLGALAGGLMRAAGLGQEPKRTAKPRTQAKAQPQEG
ncbi:HGxxPAAW family protein [Streptomyces sp. DSM 41527]|uniref:HGxxPAAW family protein n=1 Tax=Streptomyces mooreae TaxID=3075523 RepID=A0ABU2T499_9ACTN|nr:HGxxPAAW family protein [Streptomyces sp. DSM 41527]MDT0456056.1 HGxxPAAW family protein [Streptomyces sp. DSM 41527]